MRNLFAALCSVSMTTLPAIDPPQLGPPCFMMAVDPGVANALSWMPVAGAVSYTVQLATENSFAVLTAEQTTSATSLPMPSIQYESHYFWRVRAFDGLSYSSWSFECEFFTGINSTTPAPVPQDPPNGSTVANTSPTLFWTSIPATGWEVQWATNATFSGASSMNVPSTIWTTTGLLNGQTYYWRVRRVVPGGPGTWSATWSFTVAPASTALTLRCFLQGPLNSGTLLMSDALRVAGLVPATEPYTAMGYTGIPGPIQSISAGVLAATGNNAVVDWVLLEIWHATTNTVLARWPLVLQRDGDVMKPDGSPLNLAFPATQVRLAVRHRNHLGCLGTTALNTNGGAVTLDLTLSTTPVYGTAPTATVSGRRALWSGNANMNADVRYTGSGNDRDPILLRVGSTTPNNTLSGYFPEDVNLDGAVKYTGAGNDRDPILVNVGSTSPNNTRTQQLP